MEINSREWYEKVYHDPAKLPAFSDYIQSAIDRGYKRRFTDVMDEAVKSIPSNGAAIEMAAHLGKTAFWLHERLLGYSIDAFDYSAPAVEYLSKNIGHIFRNLWNAQVDNIPAPDLEYDLITCIDVVEHLDGPVYTGMLLEIARVLKPGGHAIIFGSMATHNTHKAIRNPATIIKDCMGVLKYVRMLPHNHILFRSGK